MREAMRGRKGRSMQVGGNWLRCGMAAIALCALLGALQANAKPKLPITNAASSVSTPELDYTTRIHPSQGIQSLGNNAFGEIAEPLTGALTFLQTDAAMPGIGPDLMIHRGFDVAHEGSIYWPHIGNFADWLLELPRITTVLYSDNQNAFTILNAPPHGTWYGSGSTPTTSRCTAFGAPPVYNPGGGITIDSALWWQGVQLVLPGEGTQELLARAADNTLAPSVSFGLNGSPAFPLVTTQHWMIGCLPTTANGEAGEGFFAVAPNGTQYTFNWLVYDFIPPTTLPTPYEDYNPFQRIRASLLVTHIQDRFGNALTFHYSGRTLTEISASDGRDLTISYRSDTAADPLFAVYYINTITLQPTAGAPRIWTYNYTGLTGAPLSQVDLTTVTLNSVTLPDGSAWSFAMGTLNNICGIVAQDAYPFDLPPAGCVAASSIDDRHFTGSITAPSGLTGTFTVEKLAHARTGGPPGGLGVQEYAGRYNPCARQFASLIAKSYAGVAVNDSWSYAYAPAIPISGDGRTQACNPTASATVTITQPDNTTTVETYDNTWGATETDLQRIDDGATLTAGVVTSATRTRNWTFASASAGPFPALIGTAPELFVNYDRLQTLRPLATRTIAQDSDTYSWSASAYDGYGNPVGITRSNSTGQSRTDSLMYFYDIAHWVLGQTQTRVNTDTGVTELNQTFDTAALLHTRAQNGQTLQTYVWNAQGLLSSATDGKSHTIGFSNYLYGVPQTITYPDSNTKTIGVDAFGDVTSITDETNAVTNYGYDAMGRLNSITYPAGDDVAWNSTSLSFAPVATSEFGLPAGHWKQTVTTGTGVASTYFDGRWRPVLTRAVDTANVSGTQTTTLRQFDYMGRTTFTSYPQRTITIPSSVNGVGSVYDVLGRITSTTAASELGPLTTQIQYLFGIRKQVTDPRNYITTTTYEAFDTPNDAVPINIASPEGVTVAMTRDVLGKPTAITRSGTYNGSPLSATRSYVYDSYQRLCKTIDPERGATIQDYDAANNVAWVASGLALPSTTSCDRSSVTAAQKATNTYDARNSLLGTTFGDGSPSLGYTYTADELPWTVTSNGSTWTYLYDKRRFLQSETLALGTSSYALAYAYDTNGYTQQLTYPDNTSVSYAPNALGTPSQVGSYATAVTTLPNGAVAGFTYGNGIAHALTQNTRTLPSESKDTGVIDDVVVYDENANVASITDQQRNVSTRSLGYDGLNRLTSAQASNLWGVASYTYDPLDNLRTSSVGTRSETHLYDAATNRLTGLSGTQSWGFSYNARGNLIQRSSQAFVFDLADRLTQATGKATYSYDGFGRRTRVAENSGTSRVQMYDHSGQLRYASCTGSAGCTTPGGDRIFANGFETPTVSTFTTRYISLNRHLIAEDGTNGVAYVHTDGLGSPIATTSPTKTVTSRSYYEPYGASTTNGYNDAPGFAGHVSDADTGLSYMQARYYDPISARFLGIDPIATNGATASNFNRYAYVSNNPYSGVDPDGREGPSGGGQEGIGVAEEQVIDETLCRTEACFNQSLSKGIGSLQKGIGTGVNIVDKAMVEVVQTAPLMMIPVVGELREIEVTAQAVGDASAVAKVVPALRQQYVDAVAKLVDSASGLRGVGATSEDIARALHAERNALKLQYRQLSPADLVKKFEQRNIDKYGNPLGPSIDQLRAQGKTWDQIIESATRPGGEDLGY